MAVVHACGTDNVAIDVARPKPAVTAAPPAPPGFVKSDRNAAAVSNAAALFRELRCVSAKSKGAVSELSLDRGDVTDDRDASTVVSGEAEKACSASGIADITSRPADITSGADVTAQVPTTPSPAGPAAAAGELNGVTIEASAEAAA